jgi:hypothetical protein
MKKSFFGYLLGPPSWILKNPQGWRPATLAKFHWDIQNYQKNAKKLL